MRAKAKIRDEAIPYEVPEPDELSGRIESVLQVIYLIFTRGLCRNRRAQPQTQRPLRGGDPVGSAPGRPLGRHRSVGTTRVDARARRTLGHAPGRSRGSSSCSRSRTGRCWDRALIAEAQGLINRAMTARRVGPYLFQAAIASLHAEAASFDQTDWVQIVGLYDGLLRAAPSPVAALNRAAAVAMRDGPRAGLAAFDAVLAGGGLDNYHLAYAARADMQRRLGLTDAARASYEHALALARQPAERRFLQKRIAELQPSPITPLPEA